MSLPKHQIPQLPSSRRPSLTELLSNSAAAATTCALVDTTHCVTVSMMRAMQSPGLAERGSPEHQAIKVAIVSGAAGVLGEAIIRMLIHEGWKVAAVDIRPKALEELLGKLDTPENVETFVLDIGDPTAVEAVCKQIFAQLGSPTVLVNNAGLLSNHKSDTPLAEWQQVFRVNVTGAFLLTQQVLPIMKSMKWGRIVNISSMAAKTGGITAGAAYAASKGALDSLTFSIAREVSQYGITCNGISPAYVKTPMVMKQLREEQRAQILVQIPVGRFCEPEEVAHTVKFLIHPLSSFITGEIIDQNGGFHMD